MLVLVVRIASINRREEYCGQEDKRRGGLDFYGEEYHGRVDERYGNERLARKKIVRELRRIM